MHESVVSCRYSCSACSSRWHLTQAIQQICMRHQILSTVPHDGPGSLASLSIIALKGKLGWSAAYVPSLYLLMLPTDLPATINAVSSRVQHHPYGSIVLASRATNCSEVRQSAGLRMDGLDRLDRWRDWMVSRLCP